MTQPIEPPPGYELLPEGSLPKKHDLWMDDQGRWQLATFNWWNNSNRYPVARRIETLAREWIPFPPEPGGRPPEFLPDRALWVTANDGIVFAIMSMALHYRIDTGYKFLAWRDCEPKPEPYVPPVPEAERSWIDDLTDEQLQELSRHPRFQDICHNLPPECRAEFEQGCRNHADMLFGQKPKKPKRREWKTACVIEYQVGSEMRQDVIGMDVYKHVREVLPDDVDPDAAKELVDILEEYRSEATGLHARIPRDTLKSLIQKCQRSTDA